MNTISVDILCKLFLLESCYRYDSVTRYGAPKFLPYVCESVGLLYRTTTC